ncbi:hypothetical protein GJV85_10900 [Sulfurimonas aquatica]|uniref:Uncharacterized protein n=1 Tax=Sulfurimonas aquatica TaxID=2672570 RepID=A0A975B1U6_9BACT|nr:hypothetical protein [Sulfurimonas aquatica]QSZ42595.1 hypothetical protein GJV85_10900 [Sulfurimonas aquatica]
MRFILLLFLTTAILYAKSKDTCFSVQLTSFIVKESSKYNFEEQEYPRSCQLISFTNMNAVRCGCHERYSDAKKKQKKLTQHYKNTMIVTTYSYRFAPKKSIVHIKPKVAAVIDLKENNKFVVQELNQTQTQTHLEVDTQKAPDISSFEVSSFIEDIVMQGNINLTTQAYITKPSTRHSSNYTLSGELELAYNKDNFKAFTKLKAQQDYHDISGGSDATKRSYLRLNELYLQYELEDSQIMFGKNIRFWGALEVNNITDNFNISEFRSDPVENDKIGSWNASYTHYTDSGEMSLIAKFYEPNREMSALPYIYYPFTTNVIQYDASLITKKSVNRPSVYLKYSGSTDDEYTLDYSVIFEDGYDSQRYYTLPTSPTGTINENAYLVNKIITYNTLVLGATLYKLEAVYADVVDDDEISDYYNIGLGIEHTLTQVYKEADLGLLAEYYKYATLEDTKRDDLELFEIFQNDLFLGLRYSFNDGNDATIVGGAILDLEYNEQVYYIEYEARVYDILKLNLDYRQVEPSSSDKTAFNQMGKQKRISLKLGYFF